MKSESVKGRGPENLLRLDTAAVKEVTKEGRDVSGLGAREVLVVRDVLSSIVWTLQSFFASQTLHNVNFFKKKSGDVNKEANFSLFILLDPGYCVGVARTIP